MFSSTRSVSGRLLAAAAAAAALAAATAVPAAAAPTMLPTVVDGVRYSPAQMHRFANHRLYGRISDDGKTLIGYTQLRDYVRALRSHGLQLPTRSDVDKPRARSSVAGDSARICRDNFLGGVCREVPSGWGLAAMTALDCDLGGCNAFDNAVSSVLTRRVSLMLFDVVGFNLAGCSCSTMWTAVTILPGRQVDLDTVGFNDRASSMYVYW
jgi:hypothetical protein